MQIGHDSPLEAAVDTSVHCRLGYVRKGNPLRSPHITPAKGRGRHY